MSATAGIRTTPDPVGELYEKGNDYFRRGSYPAAIKVFEMIVNNHPDHPLAPESLFSIASAWQKERDWTRSQATYDDLVRRYPTSVAVPDALLQAGTVAQSRGDNAMAKHYWTRLQESYSGSVAARIAASRLRSMDVPVLTAPPSPVQDIKTIPPMPAMPAPQMPSMPSTAREMPMPAMPAPMMTDAPDMQAGRPAFYTVKKGDSLSAIAQQLLGSAKKYRELAEYNSLPPPYLIHPGQQLSIPGGQSPMSAPIPSTGNRSAPTIPTMPSMQMPSMPAQPAMQSPEMSEVSSMLDALQRSVEQMRPAPADAHNQAAAAVMAKHNEFLKAQMAAAQSANQKLKEELIGEIERRKKLKDENVKLADEMAALRQTLSNNQVYKLRAKQMEDKTGDMMDKISKLETEVRKLNDDLRRVHLEHNQIVYSLKTEFADTLARTRRQHEREIDTSSLEISQLQAELGQKSYALEALKKDYASVMQKTSNLQKEIIRERQTEVGKMSAKEALERARQLRQDNNYGEAVTAYKTALEIYPDYADAMNGLAFLYAEMKQNLDAAESMVSRAIKLDPAGRGYYLDTLGWVQYAQGSWPSAVNSLLEAMQTLPRDDLPARAAVSYHLGMVYLAVNDRDKAFFQFIDAIKMAPRSKWATMSERQLDAL